MNTLQDNVLQDRVEAFLAENPSSGGGIEAILAGNNISIDASQNPSTPTVSVVNVVQTISAGNNITITGTATNPIINAAGISGGGILGIVAGDNITVDDTDPSYPIISATSSNTLTPQALTFLNNPSANSFATFLGANEITGTGRIVRSTDPSLTFGNTAGRALVTTTAGAVTTVEATESATANSIVRRNSSGGFSFAGNLTATTSASISLSAANSNITVNGSIGLNSSGYVVRFIAPILSGNVDLTLSSTTGTILTGSPNAVAFLNNPTSQNLRTLINDETGTDKAVFSRSPILENPTVTDFEETEVNLGNISGSVSLALYSGTQLRGVLTGNCTFQMPSVSSATSKSFCLLLSSGTGGFTTFFTGVLWPDSARPVQTPTAWSRDLYTFTSFNGQWLGNVIQNYS